MNKMRRVAFGNASAMALNGSPRKGYVWGADDASLLPPLPGIGFDSPQCAIFSYFVIEV